MKDFEPYEWVTRYENEVKPLFRYIIAQSTYNHKGQLANDIVENIRFLKNEGVEPTPIKVYERVLQTARPWDLISSLGIYDLFENAVLYYQDFEELTKKQKKNINWVKYTERMYNK